MAPGFRLLPAQIAEMVALVSHLNSAATPSHDDMEALTASFSTSLVYLETITTTEKVICNGLKLSTIADVSLLISIISSDYRTATENRC
jgi:hypothetical protein